MTDVQVLDATLREGEQTPGVSLAPDRKVEIARRLDRVGVDYVEAGHPAVAPAVAEGVRRVAAEDLDADVVAHARALRSDVDDALDLDADWVGIFFAVGDRSLEERFRVDLDLALERIADTVEYAKDHGLGVRYTPEDTVRSAFDNVRRAAQVAVEAGADRISVADTAGGMTPWRMEAFVGRLDDAVPVPLHVHCHDDLGLAVANSLAAVRAGACCVDVAVNGLGERAGITDLAAFLAAARVHGDVDGFDLEEIPDLSRLVAEASGVDVAPTRPVVGANAFTHNAGLHVSAVLQDPWHYEVLAAEEVGRQRDVCIDRFSGRQALRHAVERLGYRPDDEALDALLSAVKEGDGRRLGDDDLLALIARTQLLEPEVPP